VTEYRVAELAGLAGTTVRNVRVYQDRGLLPKPERRGRIGVYSAVHLARLRMIGRLLERGYTFATIGELLQAWQNGRDLADVLGLDAILTRPGSDEVATMVSRGELSERFGDQATPAALERAERLGFVRADGDRFVVSSPRLLDAATELVAAGIPLRRVLDLAETVQQHVVAQFVGMVADQALPSGELPAG
jgi:DNA-binding transcriptional MerR regulator